MLNTEWVLWILTKVIFNFLIWPKEEFRELGCFLLLLLSRDHSRTFYSFLSFHTSEASLTFWGGFWKQRDQKINANGDVNLRTGRSECFIKKGLFWGRFFGQNLRVSSHCGAAEPRSCVGLIKSPHSRLPPPPPLLEKINTKPVGGGGSILTLLLTLLPLHVPAGKPKGRASWSVEGTLAAMALQRWLMLGTLATVFLLCVYVLRVTQETSWAAPPLRFFLQGGSRWAKTHLSWAPSYTFFWFFCSFNILCPKLLLKCYLLAKSFPLSSKIKILMSLLHGRGA